MEGVSRNLNSMLRSFTTYPIGQYSTKSKRIYMIDTELADYTSYWKSNDGLKYFLLCIDMFSRYMWAKAPRNKTRKEMVSAFDGKSLTHESFWNAK